MLVGSCKFLFTGSRTTKLLSVNHPFFYRFLFNHLKLFSFLSSNSRLFLVLVFFIHRIRHFAGTLNYSIDDFVEKNSDKIPKHLSSGLYQSKLAIVQNLFPEGNKKYLTHVLRAFSHAKCFVLFLLGIGNPKRASKKPTNCSSILRTSLQNLLSKIELRKCHYVFCIKSNDKCLPKTFEIPIVQHQVRYMR
jgi:myosin heavy subunit